MTADQIFELCRVRLGQQRRRSIAGPPHRPVYRTDDPACRCPVGWLIPDSLYGRHMEGMTVDRLVAEFPGLRRHILASDLTLQDGVWLLQRLQNVHDAIWSWQPDEDGGGLSPYGVGLLGELRDELANRPRIGRAP